MSNTQDANSPHKKWYQEFWAWFILAPLIVVVIVSSFTVSVAIRGADDRVVDNYYKEGRMINARLDEDVLAGELDMTAALTFDRSIDELGIVLSNNLQQYPDAIYLELSHMSDQSQDHKLTLQHIAQGHYQTELDQPLNYRWYLRLRSDGQPAPINLDDTDSSSKDVWRLRGEINFAEQSAVTLTANW
ncbi:FixH family protein [Eionea flava]